MGICTQAWLSAEMNYPNRVTLAGKQIDTMELVSKLRTFRGRKTRREMAEALGHNDDVSYRTICNVCKRYEVAAATAPRGKKNDNVSTDPDRTDTAVSGGLHASPDSSQLST